MKGKGMVYLVDDEPGMLKALARLLGAEGYGVSAFSSAEDFLANCPADAAGCLVLDVAMPGLDGMALQERLKGGGDLLPIVFLTGHGDIPMSVRAIKSGAVDFLTKPVADVALLAAVASAMRVTEDRLAEDAALADLRARLARLTPRELEVMRQVITGKLNKQIAGVLGTGEQTIKVHRMRMLEKMGVVSVAELVRAAGRLGVEPAED